VECGNDAPYFFSFSISGHRGVGKLVSVRHASLLLPALHIVEKMATNTRNRKDDIYSLLYIVEKPTLDMQIPNWIFPVSKF
jgi:hypothetical protein